MDPRGSSRLTCASAAICLVVLLLGGCDSGPSTIPVSGKVTVDGQPLSKGTLRFIPDASKGNTLEIEPAATIEGGSYTLYTSGKPGAAAGAYKVAVVSQEEIDSTNPVPPKSPFDPKFSDPQLTPLAVEVKTGAAPETYDLKLTK